MATTLTPVVPLAHDYGAAEHAGSTTAGLPKRGAEPEPDLPEGGSVFYRQDSCISTFAASKQFEVCTLSVISFNAIFIGLEIDMNNPAPGEEEHWFWTTSNQVFCVYFTVEILIRFAAFTEKVHCLYDRWFVFDSILVVMMIAETWLMNLMIDPRESSPLGGLEVLRLLRLLRLSRLARLMRSVPELVTIVRGITRSIRSVGTVLGFLIVLAYVFAIVFAGEYMPATGHPTGNPCIDMDFVVQEYFCNIGMSMFTLFMQGTLLDDVDPFVRPLYDNHKGLTLLFFLFIFIASFTVLNMLIGILCDVVGDTRREEEERTRMEKIQDVFRKSFYEIDRNGNGTVSEKEFEAMCKNNLVMKTLEKKMGIDQETVAEMKTLLFSDGKENGNRELPFTEFLKVLASLSPDNEAGPLDVKQFRKALRDHECELRTSFTEVVFQLKRIADTREELSRVHQSFVKESQADLGSIANVRKNIASAVVNPEQSAVPELTPEQEERAQEQADVMAEQLDIEELALPMPIGQTQQQQQQQQQPTQPSFDATKRGTLPPAFPEQLQALLAGSSIDDIMEELQCRYKSQVQKLVVSPQPFMPIVACQPAG